MCHNPLSKFVTVCLDVEPVLVPIKVTPVCTATSCPYVIVVVGGVTVRPGDELDIVLEIVGVVDVVEGKRGSVGDADKEEEEEEEEDVPEEVEAVNV